MVLCCVDKSASLGNWFLVLLLPDHTWTWRSAFCHLDRLPRAAVTPQALVKVVEEKAALVFRVPAQSCSFASIGRGQELTLGILGDTGMDLEFQCPITCGNILICSSLTWQSKHSQPLLSSRASHTSFSLSCLGLIY
jgi:hypothetical protein